MDNKLYQSAGRSACSTRGVRVDRRPDKAEPADKKTTEEPVVHQDRGRLAAAGRAGRGLHPRRDLPRAGARQGAGPGRPGADFPDAPVEPAIYKQLKGPHRMIIGLANDEIGYIIPKRQWDEKEAGLILCRAFKELVEEKVGKSRYRPRIRKTRLLGTRVCCNSHPNANTPTPTLDKISMGHRPTLRRSAISPAIATGKSKRPASWNSRPSL